MLSVLLSLYVFIGGPSVGKTTTLHILKEMGEKVIEEAASDLIEKELKRGVKEPWSKEGFCWDVLQLQLNREDPFLKAEKRIFVDRGVFDHFAYLEMREREQTTEYDRIASLLKAIGNQRYRIAFYFEPWSQFICEENAIRHESTEEAQQIADLIHTVYQNSGFEIIAVPGDQTPQERALFILNTVRSFEGF